MKSNKGFTLLLAALIGSIVLAVGAAIYSIAQKQITLSGVGRDSQFAFYAADSGIECGQYWDQAPPINNATEDASFFGTTTPYVNNDKTKTYNAYCDGQPIIVTRQSAYPRYQVDTPDRYTIQFSYDVSGKYCAIVTLTKTRDLISNPNDPASQTPYFMSLIHADGYNVTCANLNNPRALQRSSELCFGSLQTPDNPNGFCQK